MKGWGEECRVWGGRGTGLSTRAAWAERVVVFGRCEPVWGR